MPDDKSAFMHRLSARDRDVLAQVYRDRLTTIAALRHRLLVGLSRNAATKITRRLQQRGYLQQYTLIHPTCYFVLGELGAQFMGLGKHRAEALGPQSLPQEFAAMTYATFSKGLRLRLTKHEVRELYPWIPSRLLEATFCIEKATKVLELLRVDLGGPVDHVARKCVADIGELLDRPEFKSLVESACFRLVIITATREKCVSLRQALDSHCWPRGLHIHFSIVRELLSLTGSHTHA